MSRPYNSTHPAAGESVGQIIVFADDGYLSNLEIVWYEEPVSPFPPLDRLRPVKSGTRGPAS